jgi:hypothetical protein
MVESCNEKPYTENKSAQASVSTSEYLKIDKKSNDNSVINNLFNPVTNMVYFLYNY